jgi:hypothetical protein
VRPQRMALAPSEEGTGFVFVVVTLIHGVIVRESGRSSKRKRLKMYSLTILDAPLSRGMTA